jgi:hypothetical protein
MDTTTAALLTIGFALVGALVLNGNRLAPRRRRRVIFTCHSCHGSMTALLRDPAEVAPWVQAAIEAHMEQCHPDAEDGAEFCAGIHVPTAWSQQVTVPWEEK